MKALVYTKYGNPDKVLSLVEKDIPAPKPNEVLVKVIASSVNSWDYDLISGKPLIYRLIFGLFKPKYNIAGIDIAGTVEKVGQQVKNLTLGDEVFGDISGAGFGAFAEYVCCDSKWLAKKPGELNFTHAACLPHAGVLALQSINSIKTWHPGLKVLINGAGGSVGPLAVQLAKLKKAEVTVVDKAEKFDMLKALGADYFIDYTQHDFSQTDTKYDLIIEMLAQKTTQHYSRVLSKNGSLVVVGGKPKKLIQIALMGAIYPLFSQKKLQLLMHTPNQADLNTLADLYCNKQLQPIIAGTFSLADVPKAIKLLGEGNITGKASIEIASKPETH